jgi:hypothetical protein
MAKFCDVFRRKHRKTRVRNSVIELVSVRVAAVPDPERPEDRLAMKISAELGDDLRPGISWIDEDLKNRVRTICRSGRRRPFHRSAGQPACHTHQAAQGIRWVDVTAQRIIGAITGTGMCSRTLFP